MPRYLADLLISLPMIYVGLRYLMIPSVPDMDLSQQRAVIAGCLTLIVWGTVLTFVSLFISSTEIFKDISFSVLMVPVVMYAVVAWWQERNKNIKNKDD